MKVQINSFARCNYIYKIGLNRNNQFNTRDGANRGNARRGGGDAGNLQVQPHTEY